jgi:hypothetical protein
MEVLGTVNSRQVFYCNVREGQNWFEQLPITNWIAFTIVDPEDQELIDNIVQRSLDKNVAAVSCAGQYASETEDLFVDEIVLRNIQKEEESGELGDYETSAMLTFHRNFSEGFWFATSAANPSIDDQYVTIESVICIDLTIKRVRTHLKQLIEAFNNGELPSDNEIELPQYDYES